MTITGCCAGGTAAGEVAGAVVVVVTMPGAAPAPTAATAFWQEGDRPAAFFCRHCSAAAPPGGTLAQWAR